ncbi:MAG: hypothetical protein ACTHMC_23255 [Pseudobacter sp.]|uniref:hypothetical protein n=1 Tax=Pseudobacter sp. TaxID=2045420 RepID=UPI003F804852
MITVLHNDSVNPNYIVPNISSVVRCIRNAEGLTVIADCCCRDEVKSGELKLVWKGNAPIDNRDGYPEDMIGPDTPAPTYARILKKVSDTSKASPK